MTDPIADMLTRIRNASAAGHEVVRAPHSILKEELASALVREGFLSGFERKGRAPKRILEMTLKTIGGSPAIEGVKRISRPGHRVYRSVARLGRVRYGMGSIILSTPQGVLSDKEARQKKTGGEVLCEIW